MKKRMQSMGMSVVLAATLLTGCGDDPQIVDPPQVSQRCTSSTEYLAFDSANHAAQDLRLKKIDEILAKFDEAVANLSLAPTKATEVLALYQGTDANLQAKVKGRQDMRFSPPQVVGQEMDTAITGAIEELRNATTAHQVRLAKQKIDKSGFARFLYLSVMEELLEPTLEHYDEAYGYLGTGQTNAEAGRKGLARTATRRDATNGTTLAPELFSLIVEGGCTIETALKKLNKESMEPEEDEAYMRMTRQMDAKLQLVFAYSIGHELFEYAESSTNAPTAHLELVEMDGFLRTIEPSMQQAGGAKASLATELRAAINAALQVATPDKTDWITSFKASEFLTKLEAAYSIDVKG